MDDAATKPRTWGRWWGLQYYVMWHWNQGSEFWKMVTDPSSAAEQLGVRRDDTRRPRRDLPVAASRPAPPAARRDLPAISPQVRRYLAMFCVRAFYRILWWWNIYKWWCDLPAYPPSRAPRARRVGDTHATLALSRSPTALHCTPTGGWCPRG